MVSSFAAHRNPPTDVVVLIDFNDFDFNKTGTIPIIDFARNFTLFDDTLPCPSANGRPAYTGTFESDVQAKAHARITVGVAAAGTIIPPDITEFGVFAAAEADFSGILTMSGSAIVSFRLYNSKS